ncbi:MAG: hypothetical protein UU48_C0003G0064 [Candidatus Uhrbacteria bacterium GW2011_GWF2_41_16]|uniref:Uncharacterized protein n=2 Tax=Candidatus Uhriibacteriota TaxID=1752732 RepID=A0A0G0YDK0_9BACT|nr:MAG: hypothetical protein UU31_C0010G0004 [Candidatus Uhrbacteria bacterium GW2011_GWA2_41_10]KKR87437.1 MAG: hypothetical protein UU35_C0003G0064 [Candidatus Uhrbacteria bacterium GW2011_GWC2_41_11]KKR98392.1 MAG: hypothetical protein UU48_C0003G0064 [Candidatus Uhrbacteria bacterium GW2011_GWF2_41_16]HBP00506.1 hypothetical protein [Candidatus Uhrbacteria bacterium]
MRLYHGWIIFAILLAFNVSPTHAEMSSSNFQIKWDTISQGGSENASSASYRLYDTVGNIGAGSSSGSTFNLQAGYRAGVFDQTILFNVLSQVTSSERAAMNLVGNIITTDPSGLIVGNLVALIQDKGQTQVAAVGQITSIGVGTVTIDEFADGGTLPTIDGTNDVVYLLEGETLDFQELTDTEVKTAIIGMEVSTDVVGGYTVQVFDDGNLRIGTEEISDVLDGSVTVGQTEYGGRSSDTTISDSTFDTQDTGFTTDFQTVVEKNEASFSDRHFMTLKASISSAVENGTYSHALSFIISGNF